MPQGLTRFGTVSTCVLDLAAPPVAVNVVVIVNFNDCLRRVWRDARCSVQTIVATPATGMRLVMMHRRVTLLPDFDVAVWTALPAQFVMIVLVKTTDFVL